MPGALPKPEQGSSAQAQADVDPSGDWELHWDHTFAGWAPPVLKGKLSFRREGARWTGQLRFSQSVAPASLESLRVTSDQLEATFRWGEDDWLELSGWIREGRLVGETRSGRVPSTPVDGRRLGPSKLLPGRVDHSLPSAEPAASCGAPAALNSLLEHAAAEHSTAIVIVKDGKVAVEAYLEGYDGSPLVAMSVAKSIASLAVGLLVADGRLSLDTTMGALFPEWKCTDPRSRITVRQLLTHTSGLDPSRADWKKEPIRRHALEAKLVFEPGTRFQYNNGAVDFLSVVFKQASGVALDEALEARIFRKLDIVGACWMKDSEGTPRAGGEFFVRPADLRKTRPTHARRWGVERRAHPASRVD